MLTIDGEDAPLFASDTTADVSETLGDLRLTEHMPGHLLQGKVVVAGLRAALNCRGIALGCRQWRNPQEPLGQVGCSLRGHSRVNRSYHRIRRPITCWELYPELLESSH